MARARLAAGLACRLGWLRLAGFQARERVLGRRLASMRADRLRGTLRTQQALV